MLPAYTLIQLTEPSFLFGRLRDTVRSSLYNLSPRSPRSMKRKFSSQGNTPSHSPSQSRSVSSPALLSIQTTSTPRRRKEPPPPLDLSSLSAFRTLGEVKTAERKFIGKLDKRKGERLDRKARTDAEKSYDDGHVQEMKPPRKITLKGILRSVRSISNLRGGH